MPTETSASEDRGRFARASSADRAFAPSFLLFPPVHIRHFALCSPPWFPNTVEISHSASMESKLRKISLPFFTWFILPGINIVALNLMLPIVILHPTYLLDLKSIGAAISLLSIALAMGFTLDSLKAYQWTPGYRESTKKFFVDLATELDMTEDQARVVFDMLRLATSKNPTVDAVVQTEHARWVMINHSSKSFFFLGLQVLAVASYVLFVPNSRDSVKVFGMAHYPWSMALLFVLSVVAVTIGLRLNRVSEDHRKLSNKRYLLLIKANREVFRRLLEMKLD